VHHPEHDEDEADLAGERLDDLRDGLGSGVELQLQGDVPEVDEVEAHDEQMVDGVRQGLVAAEDVEEEAPPVPEERGRHPHRQQHARGHVDQVLDDLAVHGCSPDGEPGAASRR
jgi:hypothetical protein